MSKTLMLLLKLLLLLLDHIRELLDDPEPDDPNALAPVTKPKT